MSVSLFIGKREEVIRAGHQSQRRLKGDVGPALGAEPNLAAVGRPILTTNPQILTLFQTNSLSNTVFPIPAARGGSAELTADLRS
jgi:hypothetical protein